MHYLRSAVSFGNPFMDTAPGDYVGSIFVAIWRPGPAPAQPPRWRESPAVRPARAVCGAGGAEPEVELLRVRRCSACRKWRLLPRHQAEGAWAGAGGHFECSALADRRHASCSAPQLVFTW